MKTFNGTAFAKLNLYLGIHGLREDGYHELETVFQAIDLCDLVSVSVHHRGGISLRCNRPYLPVDNRNLAYKAAEAFSGLPGWKIPVCTSTSKRSSRWAPVWPAAAPMPPVYCGC